MPITEEEQAAITALCSAFGALKLSQEDELMAWNAALTALERRRYSGRARSRETERELAQHLLANRRLGESR